MNMNTNSSVTRDQVLHVHLALNEPSQLEALEKSVYQKRAQLFLKRSFDIVVALILILLASPILLAVAFIIKITSRGPILYSNDRIGLGGKHFKCHKFRSMVSDHSIRQKDHKRA